MHPAMKNSVAASFKQHLWLPAVIAIFLLRGQAANAQDSSSIDFDQGCVSECFAGYQTALAAYCPGKNEENGVYDCAATSCDMTKEVANMYVAGYMMQVSKANNTFCLQDSVTTSTISVTASKTSSTASTPATSTVRTTTRDPSPTVARPDTSDVSATDNEQESDAEKTPKAKEGAALGMRDLSDVRSVMLVAQLVIIGGAMTMFA